MKKQPIEIHNCCDGALRMEFDRCMREIGEDIRRRPGNVKTRKIVLTIEITPSSEDNSLRQECYGKTTTPPHRFTGVAKTRDDGTIDQVIDGQLDLLDDERNQRVIELTTAGEQQQQTKEATNNV